MPARHLAGLPRRQAWLRSWRLLLPIGAAVVAKRRADDLHDADDKVPEESGPGLDAEGVEDLQDAGDEKDDAEEKTGRQGRIDRQENGEGSRDDQRETEFFVEGD